MKKRLKCFALAVVYMLMVLLPASVFAVEPENQAPLKRDTILMLDTSGSMRNTPSQAMKESAVKFCEQLLSSKDDNRVALIIWNDSYETYPFGQDFAFAESVIQNIQADGGTDTAQALQVAKSMMDDFARADAVKNIILLTDGLPEHGEEVPDGRYTRNDSEHYQRANAAYNEALNITNEYNLYTLGFLHNLSQQHLKFARRFLNDLQNAGYYEVTDPENLLFVLGEITEDITSDVSDTDPIIVIPGIMGSRLWSSNATFNDTTKVWDPNASLSGLNYMKEHVSGTLYVRPCEVQQGNSYPEYGAKDTYKHLVNALCRAFPERPVYFFSYDWRQSNEESARRLMATIQNVLAEQGAEQVDLVCHSMGGLVASSCYTQLKSTQSDNLIDKIITCGTPYEGAPKVFNSVLNWDILGNGIVFGEDNFNDMMLGIFGNLTKSTKSKFKGVAELVPTENYVGKIAMQKDSKWPFGWFDYDLSYDAYVKACKTIFENFDDVISFQNSLHDAQSEYNVLLGYDNAYFAVGINQPTITAVKFERHISTDLQDVYYESDVNYSTKGDGTVPYLSSTIMEQMEELPSKRFSKFSVNHEGIIGNASNNAVSWAIQILKSGKSSRPADEFDLSGYTVVRIACPVDVTVTKNNESLSSSPDNFSASAYYGRMDILGENDDIKMLCVQTGENYNVVLNGTGEGTMDYTVRFYDGEENLYDERLFENVPVTPETIIYTNLNEEGDTVLEIDLNGDGVIDEIRSVAPNKISGYTITFDPNGGVMTDDFTMTTNKDGRLLKPLPTNVIHPDHRLFLGWTTEPDSEILVTPVHTFKEDTTLYALWS